MKTTRHPPLIRTLPEPMILDCLQRHLAVCSQPDLPGWAKDEPDFWNLVSIREPYRAQINTAGFRKIHGIVCHDVIGTLGISEEDQKTLILPNADHVRDVFAFADETETEPLLIHCWAGVSRSTAMALGLIVRGMHWDGYEPEEIAAEAPPLLLEIRPRAAPNALILRLALEEIYRDADLADHLLRELLNHPGFFGNFFTAASPG